MKKIQLIVGLGILVSLISSLFFIFRYTKDKRDKEAAQNVISEMTKSVIYYKNRENEAVAQKEVLEIGKDNLERYYESLSIDKYKLKRQVGDLKNLVNRLQAQISVSNEGIVESNTIYVSTERIDSSRGKVHLVDSMSWSNSYLSLNNKYEIKGRYRFINNQLILDSLKYVSNFEYQYNVNFVSTSYWKRESKWKIWQNKYLVTDIKLSDPSADIKSIQSIKILPPPKKFYEKGWFKIGVGVVLGAYLVK